MVRVDEFQRLEAEWVAIRGRVETAMVQRWRERFDEMEHATDAAVMNGTWQRGPADTLGVLGRARDELSHSCVLGWLLDPAGRHGLGGRMLIDLLATAGVDLADPPRRASIHLELSRPDSRADIVVRMPRHTVVIENKVDAVEQPEQCMRLADDHPDATLIFLTPTGRPPTTAGPSLHRWNNISWRLVRQVLERNLAHASGPGRRVVLDYHATLGREFP